MGNPCPLADGPTWGNIDQDRLRRVTMAYWTHITMSTCGLGAIASHGNDYRCEGMSIDGRSADRIKSES